MSCTEYEILWVHSRPGVQTLTDSIKEAIAKAAENGWAVKSVAFRDKDTLMVVLVK